jgi:hypothetical protein
MRYGFLANRAASARRRTPSLRMVLRQAGISAHAASTASLKASPLANP